MTPDEEHMAVIKLLNAIMQRLDRIDDSTRTICQIMQLREKNKEQ